MMQVGNVLRVAIVSWFMLCMALALVVLERVEAKHSSRAWKARHSSAANVSLTVSKWWRRGDPDDPRNPRAPGCRFRPWICNIGERPPFQMRCCRNQCVNITSDPSHCGLCGIRCPQSWQCCGRICWNVNRNPWHCGRCFNRCPFGVRCTYGMCGYSRPRAPCSPGSKPPRSPCPPGGTPPQFPCPPACPPGRRPPGLPCPPGSKPPGLPCPPMCTSGEKPPLAPCPPSCPPGDPRLELPQAQQLSTESSQQSSKNQTKQQ